MLSERILIVDDSELACRAWKRLLDARGSDVAAVHNLTDARAALKAERFDVVLLDLQLEHEWGLRLLDTTDEMWPRPAVVITSAHIDDKVAVQCMGRCVAAIPKPIDEASLLTCLDKLRKPSARSTSLPPNITRCEFSDRQIEVIRAAVEGLSERATAIRMGCELSTVKTHWQRIFEKLGCRSKAAVIFMVGVQSHPGGDP